MKAEELRAFLSRDWRRVDALKRSRWRARRRELGPAEGFRLAAALYAHVRATRPDWPSEASRRADLEHHLELSRRLRAAARRQPAR